MSDKSTKRELVGLALSNKMDKTAVIEVERRYPHPVYNKFIIRSKKYYAHDVENVCSEGDTVRIQEHKPTSKLKRWIVLNIEKKAQ
tara:strand:+ start:316 stop:573 length:258 start_codon:yes stop_codon:yes gene_type:complete